MATPKFDQYGNPIAGTAGTASTAGASGDPNSSNYGQLPTMNTSDPNAKVTLTPDAQNMGNTSTTGTTPAPQNVPSNIATTPAVSVAPAMPANTAQGNTAVLAQAQNNVLGQPDPSKTALQNDVTKQTQNFVNNPEGNYNGAQVKQAAMENADTNWAKQFEALRQQYGNTSGSGLLQQNMLQNALSHQVDMNTLGGQLDQQNYQNYIDSMTKALGQGNATSTNNANLFSQGLSNLNTVRGMAEGERSQTAQFTYDASKTATENAQQLLVQGNDLQGQKDLATLQGKIQSGIQLQSQDFTATQSALDRALKTATDNNDIQAQKDITTLKGQIDAQAQTAQNQFADNQRIQNQLFQMDTLSKTQGFQAAMQQSQQAATLAIQQGDWASAASLQKAQLTYNATKDAQDLSVAMAGLALQDKQISINGQQMTFNQIEEGIKNGQIDPQAGTDAISAAAKSIGVTVQAADPDATQKAAIKQYDDMQTTYGLSHPDQVQAVDANGKAISIKTSIDLQNVLKAGGQITGLTATGNSQFNDFVNKTTGTTTDTASIVAKVITNPSNLQGSAMPGATNHSDYVALQNKAQNFRNGGSVLDSGTYKFTSPTPTLNTVFKQADGTVYVATSGVHPEKRSWGPDKQYFTAIDVDSGKTIKIYAGE